MLKYIYWLGILLALPLLAQAQPKPKTVSSDIDRVTVFQRQARVTRKAKTNVAQGTQTLVFEKLTTAIVPNSIQVKINSRNVDLVSATSRTTVVEEKPSPAATAAATKRSAEIQDSITLLKEQVEEIRVVITATQASRQVVTGHNPLGTKKDSGYTLQEVESLMKFRRAELARIDQEILLLNRRISALNARSRQLGEENTRLNVAPTRRSYGEVVLQVQASSSTATDVEVTYLVSGASWQPLYDLKCESVSKPLTLVYKAYVQQNTGIDWKDVTLTLSSANPSLNQSRPILNPWMASLLRRQSQPYANRATLNNAATITPQSVEELDAARNSAYLRVEEDSKFSGPVTINTNNNNFTTQSEQTFTFDLSLLQSIPSDGVAHMVRIKEESIPAQYEYHVVPKLDQGAFLLAKLTDYGKYQLLGGVTNLFHEGTYVGQARLDPNVAVDTLLVSLGRDEQIVVQRQAIPSQRKETGNNVRETLGYTIKVRNNKSKSIPLVVMDHIPVSTMKELEVKLVEDGDAEVQKKYGILYWKQSLAANKTVEYEYQYELKYPKDYYIRYQ